MTRATPLTLICLLGGGAVLFGLNAFFPVPIETWFAVVGMVVFAAGLLLGLVALVRGIATLANAESRRSAGVLFPILSILIASGSWAMVVTTAIQVKRSMDQRTQLEHEHWDELHGAHKEESQQQMCTLAKPARQSCRATFTLGFERQKDETGIRTLKWLEYRDEIKEIATPDSLSREQAQPCP